MVMVMKLVPVVVVAGGLVVAARLLVAASLVVVVYLVRVLERLERRVRVVVYLVVVYLGMAAGLVVVAFGGWNCWRMAQAGTMAETAGAIASAV